MIARSFTTLFFLHLSFPVWAQPAFPLLPDLEKSHLIKALDVMNMTLDDMRFKKDVGQPAHTSGYVTNMLANPMKLPGFAEDVYERATGASLEVWPLGLRLWVEGGDLDFWRQKKPAKDAAKIDLSPLPKGLRKPVRNYLRVLSGAGPAIESAFEKLSDDDKAYIAAEYFREVFKVEDRPAVWALMQAAGISSHLIQTVIDETNQIDPKPAAMKKLDAYKRIHFGVLCKRSAHLYKALGRLREEVASVKHWPEKPVAVKTPWGTVWLGTKQDDVYTEPALLILDPAGADHYAGKAGRSNGLKDQVISAVLDLAGDDRYAGQELFGPGTAFFGVNFILDAQGNDRYEADYTGQASGIFGVAWLEDFEGRDQYEAGAASQAGAFCGMGILIDHKGDDAYKVGLYGQGYSGVMAVGLLIDKEGDDRYVAGGKEPDYGRYPDHFLSLAQGFSIGMRPFIGGGFAALIDEGGHDVYQADVYGQGVSYWYSLAMFFDRSGNDEYQIQEYGHGSGIHLSLGLFAEGGGDDTYKGFSLSQGNAHDYAVGMMFEQGGNDVYVSDHFSQGCAIHNSMAFLIDSGGDDVYDTTVVRKGQGIGNHGRTREYGSMALLIDLGGKDRYSAEAKDGSKLQRPLYGVIYDVEAKDEEK